MNIRITRKTAGREDDVQEFMGERTWVVSARELTPHGITKVTIEYASGNTIAYEVFERESTNL